MTAVMRSFSFRALVSSSRRPNFRFNDLREWAVTHAAIFTAAISLAAIREAA
ncbi:MAG: hypothetical protein ABWY47_06130 [Xanthobacteraceae bacterium]|jgi:hypothetical protein